MEFLKHAHDLLRKTEEELRTLVSDAAKSGDYDTVIRIVSWAEIVSNLTKESTKNAQQIFTQLGSAPHSQNRGRRFRKKKVHSSRAIESDYPKFFRTNDELIRVSWSKREKNEYRHKTKFAVLKLLAKIMAAQGIEGRVFSTEEFLPMQSEDGTNVPDYQAYVCISFFKKESLIDQHGRQGYSICEPSSFFDKLDLIWNRLPQHPEVNNGKK